jgi:small GTP-binding protein
MAINKKVCMLGAFAVGKTSLVRQFVHSMFSEKYQTTIGVKVDKKSLSVAGRSLNLMLWDIQGEDELHQIKAAYLRGAAGCLLVADGMRAETLQAALEIRKTVEAHAGPCPCVLAVNKADRIDDWGVTEGEIGALESAGWQVIRTSAKTGEGVEDAFTQLAEMLLAEV